MSRGIGRAFALGTAFGKAFAFAFGAAFGTAFATGRSFGAIDAEWKHAQVKSLRFGTSAHALLDSW